QVRWAGHGVADDHPPAVRRLPAPRDRDRLRGLRDLLFRPGALPESDHVTGPPPAVVVNPAKISDLDGRRREICAALAEAGWPEPLWLETTPEDPGCGQTAEAVEQGAEVVFACGGDGTVMACAGTLAGTEVALAILPSGTGNLLATNMS